MSFREWSWYEIKLPLIFPGGPVCFPRRESLPVCLAQFIVYCIQWLSGQLDGDDGCRFVVMFANAKPLPPPEGEAESESRAMNLAK